MRECVCVYMQVCVRAMNAPKKIKKEKKAKTKMLSAQPKRAVQQIHTHTYTNTHARRNLRTHMRISKRQAACVQFSRLRASAYACVVVRVSVTTSETREAETKEAEEEQQQRL